jgi:transcriptional regulator with XRE-family HTH domain
MKKGYSQTELAKEMGVARQTINRWEMNRAKPSFHNLKKIARVLDVTVEELMEDAE